MHDLPEGPYFDWVGNIATAINWWRVSINELIDYHEDVQQANWQFQNTGNEMYTCFDTQEEIDSYSDLDEECKWKGVWREDAENKWD